MQISVDRDFARFGSKSYAINKINTVDVRERKPHGIGMAVICGILSVIFVFAAIGNMGSSATDTKSGMGTMLLVAAVLAVVAYWSWKRSKIVEYQLFLMTSSSQAQAYISRDGNEVLDLRDRIEAAMVGR